MAPGIQQKIAGVVLLTVTIGIFAGGLWLLRRVNDWYEHRWPERWF